VAGLMLSQLIVRLILPVAADPRSAKEEHSGLSRNINPIR
jgi:hypothetical protein